MRSSESVKSFIKNRFEKFRSRAYKDQGGKWTVGWGHLIDLSTEQDLLTKELTVEEGDILFETDLYFKSEQFINSHVKIPLNQYEYDALASLVYNIGAGNFLTSTLLKKMYQPQYTTHDLANEFLKWNKVRIGGKLVVSNGLTTRREAEKEMFLGRKVDLT